MKFCSPQLEAEFNDNRLHPAVKAAAIVIDGIVTMWRTAHPNTTTGECTITSVYRDGAGSYHGRWQAVDIRTRDWDSTVRRNVEKTLAMIWNISCKHLQREFEPSKKHPDNAPHLHVEWDDGSIKFNT